MVLWYSTLNAWNTLSILLPIISYAYESLIIEKKMTKNAWI